MRQCGIVQGGEGLWRKTKYLNLLIVTYLFLGGAGAGAYLVLSVIELVWAQGRAGDVVANVRHGMLRHQDRAFVAEVLRRGYVASFLSVALGVVCLLADVGRPEVAYLLFVRPSLSYIAVGSFALVVLLSCSFYSSVLNCFDVARCLHRAVPFVRVVGIAAALLVMLYTGMFLRSMGRLDVWDSSWLVALFFCSAASTGVALVVVCSGGISSCKASDVLFSRLAALDCVVALAEAALAAALLASVSRFSDGANSVALLVAGDWSSVFFGGFVLCGVVVPVVCNAVGLVRGQSECMRNVVSILVLIGGFCLRLSLFQVRFV